MRIGLVTGEYPPMQGGVGAFTRELAHALDDLGHEVHVVTHREARPSPPAGERYSLQQLREPIDVAYAHLHAQARRWRWGDVNMVADVVRRYDLDVINVQYQAAAYNMLSAAINLAPWRLKGLIPVAVTFHDLRVPYLFPKVEPLRHFMVRFMARQAHGVIATNYEDYATLQTWGIEEACIRQIPIGSNITVHTPEEVDVLVTRRKLGLRPADVLLGYFGFLNESKGADTLVRALARLDERFHVVFIGGRTGASDTANNQAFLGRLERLIDEMGVGERVHWTEFLPDEAVSAHMAAADVMVLPYRDGVSLRRGTLMAALAHGRPVVSTRPATPIPALRHGKELWLAPPADADGLADAIRTVAEDDDLRQQLAVGAKQAAQQFTWDKIGRRTAAFLEELAGLNVS
ncbi:MAG: glycosyltransferase family 4 protein [Candidatus Promineifilaceae bacterium]|nr:glycosyltransferase family 4 protein [Candidatus Promineifilaceae bacterium]